MAKTPVTFEIVSRLKEVENLHSECEAVSQLYKHVNVMVAEQAPMVDAIEENVQIAEIQVEEGTKELAKALSYKQTMYPIVGGFLGACAFVMLNFCLSKKFFVDYTVLTFNNKFNLSLKKLCDNDQ